ncbi:Zn-dependent hydrolase [Neobacillus kokaensis]|uniref:Zn-dependent hydrolase n=1 Tax=Neobacillus kokaensis TaxID=2759023 RepID=A0ABQ3N426_9BACI|nr:Zn-dependent hydrolase [Neobacillus kokaensis]GHH99467.1 Zn-dependent hydrolase [Neobacillus kokaensis]
MEQVTKQSTINIERLKSRMLKMAQIGGTDRGGVSRLALSDQEKEARALFIQWLNELNMEVRVDDFGNIYGRLEGKDPNASPVMTGSHLDTVPKGGKFDGTLGVLAALEAIETMKESGIEPACPVEIVSFTNEEGARFAPQMLGSGAITGKFSKEYVYQRTDQKGLTFQSELERIGYLGEERNRPGKIASFIELHIEQGPILDSEKIAIGVVEGIAGFSWMEIKLAGQSDHSGSTPMNMRRDSLVAASSIIHEIYNWAMSKKDGTVATVGTIRTVPGIINAIPGETMFSLDIRNSDPVQLKECVKEVTRLINHIAREKQIECTVDEIASNQPIHFSPFLIETLENVCKESQLPYKKMISGAGHDSMYLNQVTDTVMIFVPSTDGKSHCEEEHTSWEDIEKGISVLYKTLCKLVNP